MKKIVVFIILILSYEIADSQVLYGVRAEQQGQEIAVYYSLESSLPCEVVLLISEDEGINWSKPLKHVSGDVGSGIRSGDKSIKWKVLEDLDHLEGNKIRFKIVVNGQKSDEAAIFLVGSKQMAKLSSQKDSLAYAFGLSVMENAKSAGFENLSDELIMQAIIDSKAGTVKLEKDKATGIINAEVRKNSQKKSDMNKKRGEDYLVANGKREGVKSTSSGLQYKSNVEGQGVMPDKNDKVTVHYHGTTIDGVVFDSSVDRGKPATFGLNQVIPGWTEGLQLMKEGSKFTFYIPQGLAYGSRAQGKIEAFSTLIFEVELIKVEKID